MTHFDASENKVQLISGNFAFLYETRTGKIELAEKSHDNPGRWPIGSVSVEDLVRFVNAIENIQN